MTKKHYILLKKTNKKEIFYIDYEKLDGYEVRPKNKIKYDGIKVNKLILINPSFIKKILIKKSKRKLEDYLKYIINIMDEDDTDPDDVIIALDSLARYRSIVMGTYRMYLEERYFKLLIQKIDLIEQELKKKLIIINNQLNQKEETKGKSR